MSSRKTKKYELNPAQTIPYFIDHIQCGKELSVRVVEKVDFAKGSFFTVLPDNARIEKLLDFAHGGIIPPIIDEKEQDRIQNESRGGHPKQIITMDRECSGFVADFLKKNNENWAVVENYMLDPTSPYAEIKNVIMIPLNSGVYYFLSQINSLDEICKTIRKSSQVWHSLVVLTRLSAALTPVLTDVTINQICENVIYVIASAYDGEGYIFWEKREGA